MVYSYITILNSDNNNIYLNTLILAESIRNTNTESDILLLHDFSIPEYKLDILRKYFTKLISVKKISFDELFKIKNYHKIIYINNNLYVNKNIDELFGLETPSARIINGNVDTTLIIYNPNETITKNTNFNDLNKFTLGGFQSTDGVHICFDCAIQLKEHLNNEQISEELDYYIKNKLKKSKIN